MRNRGGTVMLVAVLALLVLNGRSHSQDANNFAQNPTISAPIDSYHEAYAEARARYGYGVTVEVRPLVSQYVELSSQLANQMTDEELQAGIAEMTRELDSRYADDEIQAARDLLQKTIDSHPDTPSADAARRALEVLDSRFEFIPDATLEPLEEFGEP